ncbi:MAG: hypothetical protein IKW20_00075 [Bacteroidales bacterium]|nr:hypothetical protein [Bacteroidales bacterium]
MGAISIMSLLLLAMNLPMAVALHLGLKMHVNDPNCKEEVTSVRHNKTALKTIATLDAVIAFALVITSIIHG